MGLRLKSQAGDITIHTQICLQETANTSTDNRTMSALILPRAAALEGVCKQLQAIHILSHLNILTNSELKSLLHADFKAVTLNKLTFAMT